MRVSIDTEQPASPVTGYVPLHGPGNALESRSRYDFDCHPGTRPA